MSVEITQAFLTIPDQLLEMGDLRHIEDFFGSVKVVKVLLNVMEGPKNFGDPQSYLH